MQHDTRFATRGHDAGRELRAVLAQGSTRLPGLLVLALLAAACAEGVGPTPIPEPGPTPAPETSAAQSVTVAGRVMDWTMPTAPQPVPNLRLHVRAMHPTGGAVNGTPLPDVVTDASGRFEVVDAPRNFLNSSSLLFVQTAPEAEYKFLCPFYPVGGPYPSDLPVVHVSWAGNTLPAFNVGTSVSGVVAERVNGQVLPVVGATVTLDAGLQDPPSTTSETGFYMACSIVGGDQVRTITARKAGYRMVTREIFGGWDFRVDLELARE